MTKPTVYGKQRCPHCGLLWISPGSHECKLKPSDATIDHTLKPASGIQEVPAAVVEEIRRQVLAEYQGCTRRDMFAMSALQGFLAARSSTVTLAYDCYDVADAMEEARKG